MWLCVCVCVCVCESVSVSFPGHTCVWFLWGWGRMRMPVLGSRAYADACALTVCECLSVWGGHPAWVPIAGHVTGGKSQRGRGLLLPGRRAAQRGFCIFLAEASIFQRPCGQGEGRERAPEYKEQERGRRSGEHEERTGGRMDGALSVLLVLSSPGQGLGGAAAALPNPHPPKTQTASGPLSPGMALFCDAWADDFPARLTRVPGGACGVFCLRGPCWGRARDRFSLTSFKHRVESVVKAATGWGCWCPGGGGAQGPPRPFWSPRPHRSRCTVGLPGWLLWG